MDRLVTEELRHLRGVAETMKVLANHIDTALGLLMNEAQPNYMEEVFTREGPRDGEAGRRPEQEQELDTESWRASRKVALYATEDR